MSGRSDAPIMVTAAGQRRPLAVVPSSILQASRLAKGYASQRPDEKLTIKRGEKVLASITTSAEEDHL